MKSMTPLEFEEELKNYFQKTKGKNPLFSVRAMAFKLGITDSTLQKIMRGERRLGFRLATEIASKFDVTIVKKEKAKRKPSARINMSILDPNDKKQLSWINLTILEMLKLKDFEPSAEWLSQRTGLTLSVINTILNEMEEAKMLKREKNTWIDLLNDSGTSSRSEVSTETIRTMQKEVLMSSHSTVDSVEHSKREHAFTIFPINTKQLPALKKKIQKFRWELAEMFEDNPEAKDEVYCFNIGLFPLTKIKDLLP